MVASKLIEKVRVKRTFPPPEARRNLRTQAGLTQSDVAGAIGVDRASVARYEAGTREPSGEILSKYAEVLDTLTIELSAKGKHEHSN